MVASHRNNKDDADLHHLSKPGLSSKQHYRLLLIDANSGDALKLRTALTGSAYASFEIREVESLKNAVEQASVGSFDLALLDLFLPDSSGLETLTALRRSAPHLPVVVLAKLDSEAMALSALQAGAQDYFVKDHSSPGALTRTVRLAYERAHGQEALRFMTEAGASLATSLDYEDTLQQITNLAVPYMADCCIINIASPDGKVTQAAVRHIVPEKEDMLRDLYGNKPAILPAKHPVASVLKSGKSSLFANASPPFVDLSTYSLNSYKALADIGFTSGMIIPLRAPDGTIGTPSFFLSERSRRYGPEDLPIAQELALRSALAVDNARLFRQARALAAAREEILSAVSHDLRTPLTAARAGLGLLEMRIGERLDEDEAKLIGNIQNSIERLGILVADLLTYNEIEAGILTLNRERTDLRALITTAISALYPLLEKKNQTLDLDVPEPLVCSFDRKRLGQAIINLLDNAHRHTPPGTAISISGEPKPDGVHLVISDEGPGIDKSQQDLIFKRFHRITSARSGLGLGLAMARGVIDMHGGRIWVESAPGQGAAFHVEIPDVPEEP